MVGPVAVLCFGRFFEFSPDTFVEDSCTFFWHTKKLQNLSYNYGFSVVVSKIWVEFVNAKELGEIQPIMLNMDGSTSPN